MTTNDNIAVIDLIKELNYDEPEKLNKWVTDKIRTKDDFSSRYSVKIKSNGRADARPEKFVVKQDARQFIDNLCILYPYKAFFGRGETKHFSAYHSLKNGAFRTDFVVKSQKLQNNLKSEKLRSEKALENLSIFFGALSKSNNIDITEVSLRSLMQESVGNEKIIDLSKSFQISAWNDLTELKDTLKNQGESSEIYQEIGEKMNELGDKSGAIDALNQATDIEPTNGVAWAIKAGIFKDMHEKSKTEQINALSRTEQFGFIAHPIDSEEHWMSECIEDAFSNTEQLQELFIEACFFALEYWPLWENLFYNDSKGNKKQNFKPNINTVDNCGVNISRDWLFYHFVILVTRKNFTPEREVIFINILHSFSDYDSEMGPIGSFLMSSFGVNWRSTLYFNTYLIDILSWFSPKDTKRALKSMIETFKNNSYISTESLAILSNSTIRYLVWDYLGKDEYTKLYLLCEEYEHQNLKKQKLKTICSMQLNSILTAIEPITNMMSAKRIPFMYECYLKENAIGDVDEHIKKALTNAKMHTATWSSFFNNELWTTTPFASDLPKDLLSLLFISPLIEVASGDSTKIGIETLSNFTDHRASLKVVVESLPDSLISYLIAAIHDKSLQNSDNKKLKLLFKRIEEIQQEIFDEDIYYEGL